ncbi:MAG: hypothetical protein AAGG75_00880 [Bacteroidota bacterium]
MKSLMLSTTLLLLSTLFCFGQGDIERRIQEERVNFFNQELQLTDEEAKQFWPLFDQYRTDSKKLRESYNTNKKIELLSDQEVEELVFKSFEQEEKQLALRRSYFEKLQTFMPIRKIAMLKRTEQKFKKKLLNHVKQRRRQGQGRQRRN